MKKFEIALPEELQLGTLNIIAAVRAADRKKAETAKFVRGLRKTMFSRFRKLVLVLILLASVSAFMMLSLLDFRVSVAILAILLVVLGWAGSQACEALRVYRKFL